MTTGSPRPAKHEHPNCRWRKRRTREPMTWERGSAAGSRSGGSHPTASRRGPSISSLLRDGRELGAGFLKVWKRPARYQQIRSGHAGCTSQRAGGCYFLSGRACCYVLGTGGHLPSLKGPASRVQRKSRAPSRMKCTDGLKEQGILVGPCV